MVNQFFKKTVRMVLLFFAVFVFQLGAQEKIGYQKPVKEILELVDVPATPRVMLDEANEFMLMMYRNSFKTIDELSKDELRLGGLRVDPVTNIGSRVRYYNNIKIKKIKSKNVQPTKVKGLPKKPRLIFHGWSPDQRKIAMTHTTASGVQLWVVDVVNASARQLTEAKLNANVGSVVKWFADSQSLLVKMVSKKRKPLIDPKKSVPRGPKVSVNKGKKAQNRTYQDLLKNKNDEFNFRQLALSELYKVSLDGSKKKWLASNMYRDISFSPDGQYVMVSTIKKPFSYLVTYRRFPTETAIFSKEGKKIKKILDLGLIEDLPKGFMSTRKGKRNFSWRADKPATLIYVKALDGGNAQKKAEYRDEVFQLESPFEGDGTSLLKTKNRFNRIQWGNDHCAIAHDYWSDTRNTKTYLFVPSKPGQEPVIISDRNYQDSYSAPGDFVTQSNEFGREVLTIENDQVFLMGEGHTSNGQFPFVDQLNLKTSKKQRLYQSEYTDKLESLKNFDVAKGELLVRIESKNEFPNYYIRNIKTNTLAKISHFDNPFKSIQNVEKEVIRYKRADGLDLSGTLYFPLGYDKNKKEKMPMILWAYPREYKDKSSASQNTKNPNRFTYPFWASPIFWVTRGYMVLDGASFPIVGEGTTEPNDTFRRQLIANAKAAIDAVDQLGCIDRKRVAVGGHSYGAFMVANLLTHSDLFAAGIARSGAYNRTLTPFGFQSEQRSYWESPEVYNNMSPFMHAHKMKTPLLLIHGAADNNAGTYPMQSERYFNALKGLGAEVRLVMLPKESHGYRAKESILHLLWEQDRWLEKYVKNKK